MPISCIPYHPDVFDFYRKKAEAEKAYAASDDLGQIHQSLFNPISTARMNLWQTEMSERRYAWLTCGGKNGGPGRVPAKIHFLQPWIIPLDPADSGLCCRNVPADPPRRSPALPDAEQPEPCAGHFPESLLEIQQEKSQAVIGLKRYHLPSSLSRYSLIISFLILS